MGTTSGICRRCALTVLLKLLSQPAQHKENQNTGGMTSQAVQGHALGESIVADENCDSGSVKTFSIDPCTEGETFTCIGQLFHREHLGCDTEQHH